MPTKTVMDSDSVNRAVSRIVNQILERNNGARDLAIIGIRTRGVYIAERIAGRSKSWKA